MGRSMSAMHCERARRSRPAGGPLHFRAPMKVNKAKALNTDLTGSSARNPRTRSAHLMRSLAASAMHPRKVVSRIAPELFVGCCHGSEPDRIEPPCFGYFHLG